MAQFNLGYCHEMGQGTVVNHEAAFHWYLRAARQGYPRAQYHAGLAYSYGGQGVDWDLTEACKWLTLASWNGIREAEQLLRHQAFPTAARLQGEQSAKSFEATLEPRKALPARTDTSASSVPELHQGIQLGLGF